jgi:hypothetical protein
VNVSLQAGDNRRNHPTINLAALSHFPEDAFERDRIGEQMALAAFLRFEKKLSPNQLRLWQNPTDCFDYMQLVRAFDEFLLELFEHFGPALFLSRQVLDRLLKWRRHRPELFKRLGQALEDHCRIFHGEQRAPIGGDFYAFKQLAVPELKQLFRKGRTVFALRRRDPISLEIADWLLAQIEGAASQFPQLWPNRCQLHVFVAGLDETQANLLASGKLPAAEFFYLWVGSTHGRDPKKVRDIISSRKAVGRGRRSFRKFPS